MSTETEFRKLEADIKRLCEIWYRVISADHHKDHDCHWYIQKRYSYAGELSYEVQHFGYLIGETSTSFNSSIEAHRYLRRKIAGVLLRESEDGSDILLDIVEPELEFLKECLL